MNVEDYKVLSTPGHPDRFTCLHCDKSYVRRGSLSTHLNSCLATKNAELAKRVADLEKELQNATSATPIIHNDHSVHLTTQVVIINRFGRENQDHLEKMTGKELEQELGLEPKHDTLLRMVRMIHLHPGHPENHNVRLHTVDDKEVEVHDKNGWAARDKQDVINDMICFNRLRFYDLEGRYKRYLGPTRWRRLEALLDEAEAMSNRTTESSEDYQQLVHHIQVEICAFTNRYLGGPGGPHALAA